MSKPSTKPNTTLKSLTSQVKQLKARITDLEAYMGVLLPVIEREYKKGNWDFSKK